MNSLSSWMDQYLNGNGGSQDDDQGPIKISMIIEGSKVTEPPVPSGFKHVEGTVDNGYVIEDGDENQFVWVPVDKDQKIKINVTSEAKIDSISLTDPYGDDIPLANTTNLGTTYNNENVEPTINGPYRLTVTAGGETKKVFLSVHSLYAIDTLNDWCCTDEYAKTQGYNNLEEMLEDWDYATEEEFLMDGSLMKEYSETEDYTESVNENGGFYIARYEASYEAGEDGQGKPASKASTSTRTSSSKTLTNGMLWNYISQTEALTKANEMYAGEGFTSSLPTGAAWDRTLGWLEETGALTPVEIVGDSKTWGNYKDDTFTNTTGLINTGNFSQTEKNHIFDLAGNLDEWTTEAISTSYRVFRRW